jgi:hypothetical protein
VVPSVIIEIVKKRADPLFLWKKMQIKKTTFSNISVLKLWPIKMTLLLVSLKSKNLFTNIDNALRLGSSLKKANASLQ